MRFWGLFFALCGHLTVWGVRHFERRVKNLKIYLIRTRIVHDLFCIVYILHTLILHSYPKNRLIFGMCSLDRHTRLYNDYVQNQQIFRLFFYVCADCTNFCHQGRFLPFYSIFDGFRSSFSIYYKSGSLQASRRESSLLRAETRTKRQAHGIVDHPPPSKTRANGIVDHPRR